MKKRILVASLATIVLAFAALFIFRKSHDKRGSSALQLNETVSPVTPETFEESTRATRKDSKVAAAPTNGVAELSDVVTRHDGHNEVIAIGPITKPVAMNNRQLEYQVDVNYQIADLKGARAFFNQWVPRYGFMQSEAASGQGNGYLTLSVKVRSTNLYNALAELDAIGMLANERISVVDHTENSMLQQLLAEREQIRMRRRSTAVNQSGATSRNWQAAETLLAASEDKELQTRMEEWRISDRVQWATVTIHLTMPVVARTAAVEVPTFQNAFIGLLNLLLQFLYAAIYIVPIAALLWLAGRGALRLAPLLRNLWAVRA
jgi:hypothetical protein